MAVPLNYLVKKNLIKCDANGLDIGAVMMQDEKPLMYFSEKLMGAALNCHTYDKELFALVYTSQV